MHDPAVFGSLSNFAGWQSWGRVYSILGPFDYQLNTRVLRRTMPTGAICPVDLGIGTCLIERSNGPQSRRLANLLDRYMNGQAEEVLHHPTQARTWEIGVMLHEKLGHLKADRLMLRAAAEAYWRHPTAILALLSTSLDYFGISTVALFGFPAAPPGVVGGLFLQRAWEPDDYEMIPFNHAGIGLQTLHGRAREEYARSFRVSNRFLRLHHWAEILGVVIKTAGGLAFLCLLPFILLQALCNKGMGLFLLTLTAILIAAGVLGYGYNPKYEHTIFPAMVMSGAFGLTRLVRPRQSRGGSSAGCSAPSGISWTRSSQNYRGGILSRGASAWPFSSL